jgi:hypothetical protein
LELGKDKFWLIKRYEKRFGHLSRAEQKKLKHRRTTLDGLKGVLVPGDDGDGPYDLERRSGVRNEHDQEESVGSSGGDEEIAASKYENLAAKQNLLHAEAAQGAMQSVLMEFELDAEAQELELERMRKRKKTRKKIKQNVADLLRGPKSFFGGDASSGSDAADTGTSKVIKKLPKTGARNKCDQSTVPIVKVRGEAASGEEHAAQGSAETCVVVAGEAAAGDEDDKRSRGAPKKDCLQMEKTLWGDFQTADERSMFFSSSSDVQRRLLIRWAGTAKLKAASSTHHDERVVYERCTKRLQIMETVVKIHRGWTQRTGDHIKAYHQFDSSWNSLLQFAQCEPPEPIACPFLYDFRLQTQAFG